MTSPVQVDAGFGWTPILLVVLNAIGFSGLLVAIIRNRPLLKGIAQKREANLLEERATEMASMRERIEALETRLTVAEEETRLVRHDLANANMAVDMMISRVEAAADLGELKRQTADVKVERAKQKEKLDQERADLRKVRLAAVTK